MSNGSFLALWKEQFGDSHFSSHFHSFAFFKKQGKSNSSFSKRAQWWWLKMSKSFFYKSIAQLKRAIWWFALFCPFSLIRSIQKSTLSNCSFFALLKKEQQSNHSILLFKRVTKEQTLNCLFQKSKKVWWAKEQLSKWTIAPPSFPYCYII